MPPTADIAALRPRAAARLRLFVVLLLAVFAVQQLPLPFRLAGLPLAGWALATGIRCLADQARLRRGGQRAAGRFSLALGVGLVATMGLLLVVDAAFYPLVARTEQCLAGAVTDAAREACQDEQQRRLEELQHRLVGGS